MEIEIAIEIRDKIFMALAKYKIAVLNSSRSAWLDLDYNNHVLIIKDEHMPLYIKESFDMNPYKTLKYFKVFVYKETGIKSILNGWILTHKRTGNHIMW